jgi:hypothetical protein
MKIGRHYEVYMIPRERYVGLQFIIGPARVPDKNYTILHIGRFTIKRHWYAE